MAKCPLARSIVLTTAGSLTYTTPPSVEKAKGSHDVFLESVREALTTALSEEVSSAIETTAEKLCLTVYLKDRCYSICGHPDSVYLLYGGKLEHPVLIVLEATLSPSVKHLIQGEMLFYALATYMNYGCKAYGLVANPKYVYLVAYKANATQRLGSLIKSPNHEKALEMAEKLRAEKPWICSLCDLEHMCPLGAEV